MNPVFGSEDFMLRGEVLVTLVFTRHNTAIGLVLFNFQLFSILPRLNSTSRQYTTTTYISFKSSVPRISILISQVSSEITSPNS